MNETPRAKNSVERFSQVVCSKEEDSSMWQWQEGQDFYSDINQDFNPVNFLRHYRHYRKFFEIFQSQGKKNQYGVQKVEKLETSGKFGR